MQHPHPIKPFLQFMLTTFLSIVALASCTGGKGTNGDDSRQLTDSVYISGNYQMPGELFHGADGYDYYVARVYPDSLFTYDQAVSLQKDGWVLPKSLGYFATTWSGSVNGERMEFSTVDTDSDDPVIERMMGSPRLLVSVLPDMTYQSIVGFGEFWTATPIRENNAVYYTVRQQFNGTQMSSITDTGDHKSERKMVALVKRIERPNTVFYHNPISNRRFPARNINGYEIVDPSGGLNFTYNTPKTIYDDGRPKYDYPNGIHYAHEYEQDGWMLPNYATLSELFGTSVEATSTATAPLVLEVKRLFPPSDQGLHPFYLGRDSNGAYFSYYVTYSPEGQTMQIKTGPAPSGMTPCLRLVKKSGGNSDSNKTTTHVEDSDVKSSSDYVLLGLNCPVESVSYRREDSDSPYRTVKFNEDGSIAAPVKIKILRDDKNRIVKYEKYVGPDNEDNEEYAFSYKGESNKPYSYDYGNIGSNSSNVIEYDKEGNICKITTTVDHEGEDEPMEITLTYTIMKKDENGNWTRRRVDEEIIENYMVENAMGEYSPRQHVRNESYIETRTIKYRK